VLSHLSIYFLSLGFTQYGAHGVLSFPLGFTLPSSLGLSQRMAKYFLTFKLSFVLIDKIKTCAYDSLRSWCIKSMLSGRINAFA
jgi:hypothetical protein